MQKQIPFKIMTFVRLYIKIKKKCNVQMLYISKTVSDNIIKWPIKMKDFLLFWKWYLEQFDNINLSKLILHTKRCPLKINKFYESINKNIAWPRLFINCRNLFTYKKHKYITITYIKNKKKVWNTFLENKMYKTW